MAPAGRPIGSHTRNTHGSGGTATEKIDSEDSSPGTNPDGSPTVAFGETVPAPALGDTGKVVLGLIRKRIVVPKTGDIIAQRYRIVGVLGEGGMEQVLEVSHLKLGKSFALKLLHPSMAEDKEMCRSFFREARYASSLDHPNLISILDFGEDPNFGGYMVMELASGMSLKKFLAKRGKLRVKRACDIVSQVAEALLYMHHNELIHCDLKPDNIVISPNEKGGRKRHVVKLLDFGLAQSLGGKTRDGLFGTPTYSAPEIAKQEVTGPPADIYSLGIILFELVTGSPQELWVK
ncbi:MAG: serine/threonine protein kinase [Myxococcales bacterium]|nr:serine/threonine protein kinase [Myxococcales bacterium]